jgi:hypothetical protein
MLMSGGNRSLVKRLAEWRVRGTARDDSVQRRRHRVRRRRSRISGRHRAQHYDARSRVFRRQRLALNDNERMPRTGR